MRQNFNKKTLKALESLTFKMRAKYKPSNVEEEEVLRSESEFCLQPMMRQTEG